MTLKNKKRQTRPTGDIMKFLAAGVLDIVIITFLTNRRGAEISYTKHERNGTTGIRINFILCRRPFSLFILFIIYSASKQKQRSSTDLAYVLIL
jgi:hypothetical protein